MPTTENETPDEGVVSPRMRRALEALAARADVRDAVDYVRTNDEATLDTQIELSEIPAPPFQEAERAARMAELLRSAGLGRVEIDDVGNVVADGAGSGPEETLAAEAPPLVISAHLDTVFPAGTDVTVRREGDTLRGPGISDDARGLATLVVLVRALKACAVRTRAPLRFVATVGEEGAGDLRGVKALFSGPSAAAGVAGFISLDGAGLERIVARGLGSRRFRITIRGPGGHSWVDWGTANPAHALMELGARLSGVELGQPGVERRRSGVELPDDPKTTLTIARLGGGKSINAIPQEAWLEIDVRSAEGPALHDVAVRLDDVLGEERSRHDELDYRIEIIGDRPGGSTAPDTPLVQAALAATRFLGCEPVVALSSTDANVPMRLGVPAVTLGCGGEAGKAHTTDEWYRNTDGPDGIVRALYVILLAAGVEGRAVGAGAGR